MSTSKPGAPAVSARKEGSGLLGACPPISNPEASQGCPAPLQHQKRCASAETACSAQRWTPPTFHQLYYPPREILVSEFPTVRGRGQSPGTLPNTPTLPATTYPAPGKYLCPGQAQRWPSCHRWWYSSIGGPGTDAGTPGCPASRLLLHWA